MLILKSLNYSYDALDPYIDSATMELHHSKHLQAYVDRANALLDEANIASSDDNILNTYHHVLESGMAEKQPLLNQLGQVYNHDFYFAGLTPTATYQTPADDIAILIEKDFDNVKNLEQKLQAEAMKIFGSGWQWLVLNKASNHLELLSSTNAFFPDHHLYTHLLVIDVWEHAYYLKYQNRRAQYLENIMNIINWEMINTRLKSNQ